MQNVVLLSFYTCLCGGVKASLNCNVFSNKMFSQTFGRGRVNSMPSQPVSAMSSKLCRQVSIESPGPLLKDCVFSFDVPVPDVPPTGARIRVSCILCIRLPFSVELGKELF